MSAEHHRVRNYAVKELPRVGKPLAPEFIAQALNLPLTQVTAILDELQQHMAFLFRNEQGAVVWAYPVIVLNSYRNGESPSLSIRHINKGKTRRSIFILNSYCSLLIL
jgi:hypothetical protein